MCIIYVYVSVSQTKTNDRGTKIIIIRNFNYASMGSVWHILGIQLAYNNVIAVSKLENHTIIMFL